MTGSLTGAVNVTAPGVPGGHRVAAAMDRDELEQFQRAARLLLAHPLVTSIHPRPGALAMVRRWEVPLRNEFGRVLGYRLDLGRTCARLYRKAAIPSVHRGAQTRTGRSLGRLACSFLCLTLAALEGLGEQTTASQLSEEVLRLRSGDDALPVDLTRYDQRKAFVDAVMWMEDRAVLGLCDGSVDRWMADAERGDALYDIDHDAASRLLVAAPSVLRDVHAPADFLVDPYGSSDDAQRNRVRHRIGRRLIAGSVVSYEDLDEDEWAHLRARRRRLLDDLERLTGCEIEARNEGLVLVDAAVEPLSMEDFPSGGTVTQGALLWGAALVQAAVAPAESGARAEGEGAGSGAGDGDEGQGPRPPAATRFVSAEEADATWDRVVETYRSRFRKEAREDPDKLRRDVTDLLARFDLASVGPSGEVAVHAALARYRPAEDHSGEPTLFDGADR